MFSSVRFSRCLLPAILIGVLGCGAKPAPDGPEAVSPQAVAEQQEVQQRAGEQHVADKYPKLLSMLRYAQHSSSREWAAYHLAAFDWHMNPAVVDVLMQSAIDDPAITVRISCIRAIVKMNANTITVVDTLQELKNDPDPRVCREAEQALIQLRASSRIRK